MIFFKQSLLLLATLFIMVACGKPKSNSSDSTATVTTKEMQKPEAKKEGIKQDNGKIRKKGSVKNSTKSVSKGEYWTALRGSLKLDDTQIAGLKSIKDKYAKLKKDLPMTRGEKDKTKVKEYKKAERDETRKLLGPELFKKKSAFDKQNKKK